MTHICVSELTIIGSDNSWPAPSHYLNQCWNIVNWTLRNKLQWIFNRNSYIFIHENAFENVVCEMAAILSRPQCVNLCSSLRLNPCNPVKILPQSIFVSFIRKKGISWSLYFMRMENLVFVALNDNTLTMASHLRDFCDAVFEYTQQSSNIN